MIAGGHRLRIRVRKASARHEAPGADSWAEYERRKAEVADTASSATEYEARLADITKELGL